MSSLPVSPSSGEPSLPELFETIYGRLKELSSMFMRSQPMGHTLQPTAVVNEAFIKLAERDAGSFVSEEHFFATAATVLRSVLVDHARRRRSKKHGAGKRGASMDTFDPADRSSDVSGLLELEDAVAAGKADEARAILARIEEMRKHAHEELGVKDGPDTRGGRVRQNCRKNRASFSNSQRMSLMP